MKCHILTNRKMNCNEDVLEVDILPEENEPLNQNVSIRKNLTVCFQSFVFCLKVFKISVTFAFQACFLTFKILRLTAWDSISDFLIAYKHLR